MFSQATTAGSPMVDLPASKRCHDEMEPITRIHGGGVVDYASEFNEYLLSCTKHGLVQCRPDLPDHLYRCGMAAVVCPRIEFSSLYQDGRTHNKSSVETENDIQILGAMFNHEPITMPGDTAGISIAKVELMKRKRKEPKAYLTQNVSLDRLFDVLLNLKDNQNQNQKWFLEPRMHQKGYKDEPWTCYMPYDIIFDCQCTEVGTDGEEPDFETYTLGIIDESDLRCTKESYGVSCIS